MTHGYDVSDHLRNQLASAGEQVRNETEASAASDGATRRKKPARKFDSLRRVEGRLSTKQVNALQELVLKLTDKRGPSTEGRRERITNNTLLRVAVAAMLEHKHALAGSDEAELTESLIRHLASADAPTPVAPRSDEDSHPEYGTM